MEFTKEEKMEMLEEAMDHLEIALRAIEPMANEDPNFKAYVYDQLKEHYINENPYNQSLQSCLDALES